MKFKLNIALIILYAPKFRERDLQSKTNPTKDKEHPVSSARLHYHLFTDFSPTLSELSIRCMNDRVFAVYDIIY